MDAEIFVTSAIRPTLQDMDMWSPAAEKLLLMTACHESAGFQYRVQQGSGPALSYFQIEPATLADLYESYLVFRPQRRLLLDQYLPDGMSHSEALETIDNYACAAARLQYYRVPEPLPAVDDEEALAAYCKTYWNTEAGKATAAKYLADYQRYKPEGYGVITAA